MPILVWLLISLSLWAPGRPVDGLPLLGQSVFRRPLFDRPVDGRPVDGRPVDGRPVDGRLVYGWPVSPARVVRAFDPPARPWLPGHRGVDLAASPSVVVRAAGTGRVIYAGVLAGRGVVSVEHADGLRTTYEPVTPAVGVGDPVRLGTPIGRLLAGHPGCPVTACLHWGLRRGAVYLDPLALLGRGRVRLLPLRAGEASSAQPVPASS